MLLQTTNLKQVEFTQGETTTLTLIATDDQGNPYNLTGASLSTEIRANNGADVTTFQNSKHTLANQTTNPGQFTLALLSTDTPMCGEGNNKTIITIAVIAGATLYFRGNNTLIVYPPVPLQ